MQSQEYNQTSDMAERVCWRTWHIAWWKRIKRRPVSDIHQPWNALFPAQTVIRNDANNRSQHASGYYEQADGALSGRVWKSGVI